MREDGIAAQFTRMKARFERLDRLCIARAISSFPVPVSPKTKTVESVGATFETWTSTWRNGSEARGERQQLRARLHRELFHLAAETAGRAAHSLPLQRSWCAVPIIS